MASLGSSRLERYLFALWIAIALTYIAVYVHSGVPQTDFTPFYCAGSVLDRHQNPYLALPLARCEAPFFGNAIVPAPLPPYVLAAFRIVALMPYGLASELWRCLIVVATGAAIVALRALVRLPWPILFAAILPIALRDTIPLGQPFPIALAALGSAALAIDREREFLAGLLLSLAMIEPNIGLPACGAAFLFRPRCRLALGLGALAATMLTAFAVPFSLSVMYVRDVIPAQAASEIGWFMQYSLTHLLFVAGVAPHVALTVGSLWYVAMVVLGIALAHRLVAAGRSPATLALIPPSVVVLGGSYVHIWQIQIAIPAALMILATEHGRLRQLAVLVTVALSVPWIELGFPATAIVSVMSVFTTISLSCKRQLTLGLVAAAFVGVAAWNVTRIQPQMQPVLSPLPRLGTQDLAQVAWTQYAEKARPLHQEVALLLQVPTWAGLVFLILLATRVPESRTVEI